MSNDDKTIELITNLDRNAVERILQQVASQAQTRGLDDVITLLGNFAGMGQAELKKRAALASNPYLHRPSTARCTHSSSWSSSICTISNSAVRGEAGLQPPLKRWSCPGPANILPKPAGALAM